MRSLNRFSYLVPVLLLIACGEPEKKPAPVLTAAACAGEPTCGEATQVYVADYFGFAAKNSDGTLPGFDLDGLDSAKKESSGCYVEDLDSPDGDEGVDNQIGALLSTLPVQISSILPAAIDQAIKNGDLLFLIEVLKPGSLESSTPTGLVFRYGTGEPLLGTDRQMLPGQTFELDPDFALGHVEGVSGQANMIEGGPLDLRFRMLFISTPVEFTFRKVKLRMEKNDDGTLSGIFGGMITMEDLLGVLGLLGGDDTALRETLEALFPSLADIRNPETGECDAISGALEFRAVPAFIFDPANAPEAP